MKKVVFAFALLFSFHFSTTIGATVSSLGEAAPCSNAEDFYSVEVLDTESILKEVSFYRLSDYCANFASAACQALGLDVSTPRGFAAWQSFYAACVIATTPEN